MGWLERLTIEHDNFRAALEWLTETGDAEWGLRLGAALFRFWEMGEYLSEGRDRLDKLLKLAGQLGPSKAGARAFFAAGVLAGAQGDYGPADPLVRESLDIAVNWVTSRASPSVSTRWRSWPAIAARLQRPASLFEEGLVLWRELGDRQAEARSLSNLASVVKMQGDHARALSIYADCLSIFQGLGDRAGVAWSMNYQGDVARDQGDSAAAQNVVRTVRWKFFANSVTAGHCRHARGPGKLGERREGLCRGQFSVPGKHKTFSGTGSQTGNCPFAGVFRLLSCGSTRSRTCLRLAGAAAALRQNIGAPLTPAEQAKLEASLRLGAASTEQHRRHDGLAGRLGHAD